MEKPSIVGIDVGTTKVCTLVAELNDDQVFDIRGIGIEPMHGMKKGMINDLTAATECIARSIEKAQRSSGREIRTAIVSLAGSHISSFNSRGVVGVSNGIINQADIKRACEAAQAVAIPHNREIIHMIQRSFIVDEQEGIPDPINYHGYRLELDAIIITAAATTVENLRKCVETTGVKVNNFVLNPLASGQVVLTPSEREMGVMVCDIGGGTSDLAIYINNSVWYTSIINLGGDLITSDIAKGLHLTLDKAEEIKIEQGHANKDEIAEGETFTVRPFGEETAVRYSRKDLALIIEARVEEIFQFIMEDIRRSGYDRLLPAGMVLTGGTANLSAIRNVASRVLNLPVRIAQPDNLNGLADQLYSPAFSTSVGLLHWGNLINKAELPTGEKMPIWPKDILGRIKRVLDNFNVEKKE